LYLEYKALSSNPPSGVIVLPRLDTLFRFDGVVFVRKGMFEGGVFRFSIHCDHNHGYSLRFEKYITNPLICPTTGRVFIQFLYPDDEIISLSHVAIAAKKIFYLQNFPEEGVKNEEAYLLYRNEIEEYQMRAQTSVNQSMLKIFDGKEENSIHFSEPSPIHGIIKERIIEFSDTESGTVEHKS